MYVCTCVSNTVICYFLFPETKNKTLEEIGLLFGDKDVHMGTSPVMDEGKYSTEHHDHDHDRDHDHNPDHDHDRERRSEHV